MSCPDENLLLEYADGSASTEVHEQVQHHLDGCAACRSVVADLVRAAERSSGGGATPAASGALHKGASVNRYVILDHLGTGGMSVVYSAYDPQLDRRVALKFLLPGSAVGEEASVARARLLREAQAMARLSHPNVAPVHEAGAYGEQVFIAMEFVEGQDLSQWLAAAPRSWSEIVDVFIDAGRGLAAAHSAGIVHRDFKPANVLMSKDRRVKVSDFGLARSVGRVEATAPATALETLPADALTRSGALVGTPAYMSPEQLRGAPTTPRSDQFSFCVALYEALYGQRPFRGENWEQLQKEIAAGNLQVPDRPGVPRWLRRVVLQGLRGESESRFSSMDALLGALTRDAGVRQKRVAAAAAAVLILALGVGGYRRSEDRPRRMCEEGSHRVAQTWSPASQESIHNRFVTTQAPFALQAWTRVQQSLDAFATSWTSAYRDACESTRVQGSQSTELMDLRMDCLSDRLKELEALVQVLAQADPALAAKAPEVARALTPVAVCADTKVLLAPVRPPVDAAARTRLEALRGTLAQIKVQKDAGKYADALKLAKEAVKTAALLNYRPAQADALVLRGQLEVLNGDEQPSEATLLDAIWAGDEGRNDRARALAWIQLLRNAAGQNKPDLAEQMAQHARAAITRLGGDKDLEAGRLNALAVLRYNQGKYEDSLELFRQIVALREQVYGAESIQVVPGLYGAGMVLGSLGKYDEALTYQNRALATVKRELGPDHPDVARNLSGIGATLDRKKDFPGAAEHFEQASEIAQRTLGADHPLLAAYLSNLGDAYLKQRKFESALEVERRAFAIYEKRLPPDHPDLSFTLTGIGEALIGLGKPAEALVPLERAARLTGEPEHVGDVRLALATALAGAGKDPARARSLVVEARAAFTPNADRNRDRLAEVDRWLRDHPKRR